MNTILEALPFIFIVVVLFLIVRDYVRQWWAQFTYMPPAPPAPAPFALTVEQMMEVYHAAQKGSAQALWQWAQFEGAGALMIGSPRYTEAEKTVRAMRGRWIMVVNGAALLGKLNQQPEYMFDGRVLTKITPTVPVQKKPRTAQVTVKKSGIPDGWVLGTDGMYHDPKTVKRTAPMHINDYTPEGY